MAARKFALKMTEPVEAKVLAAVMVYLSVERRVTWGPYRVNVGILKNPRVEDAWAGWSITDASRKPARGFPDVMCAVGEVLVLIECKRPSTDLTGDQPAYRDYCEANGTRYHIVRSVDDAQAAIAAVPG